MAGSTAVEAPAGAATAWCRRVELRAPAPRAALARLRVAPVPELPGLIARGFSGSAGGICGRYLFRDRASAERFHPEHARELACAGATVAASPAPQLVSAGAVERPVFVVSPPRAGSTLLADLLGRSEQLRAAGSEAHGAIEGVPGLGLAARGFESHALGEAEATAEAVTAVRLGLAAELGGGAGRPLVKAPENALRLRFLRAAFPGASFVLLFRDARENVSSIVEAWRHDGFTTMPELPGWGADWHLVLPPGWRELAGRSVSEVAAEQWAACTRAMLSHAYDAPAASWHAVELARLLAEPRAVVRGLCDFLGMPLDAGLAAAARRPLPVSATAISHPSPAKWRFNREFGESALDPYDGLEARVERLVRGPAPVTARGPVRFSAFLDDCDDAAPPGHEAGGPLFAHPSLRCQLGVTIPLDIVRRARFRERFLPDHPIAWVDDPATRTLHPFWLRPSEAWRVAELAPGREVPAGLLPPRLAARLASAGAVGRPESWLAARRRGEEQAVAAREQLERSGFCVLRDLLHPAHVVGLRRYYRDLVASGTWELGDAQVSRRYGWHNELQARFFHHQLADYVSRVASEPVRPTYVYVSAYQEGAVLERHRDREQCRFTMSLLIDESPAGEVRWPLFFDARDGRASLVQSLGGAVLFRGDELPHWRDRLPDGMAQTALLFHYVSADFSGTHY